MNLALPALITAGHEVEAFDCGTESLNQYLKRFALTNTAAGTARTYVTTLTGLMAVIGFYSLAAGSVEKREAPERVAKGVPSHPIPVVLLARLAVDRKFQGLGVGKGLLRDALLRVSAAADIVGIRALLVHAKDERAARFYSQFGFCASPTDPLHLMLLMKDLRRTLQA
jgi:GNAT superfamily N-acetyltransferase